MHAARSSAASAAPCGCLRRSRCVPACGAGSVLGRRSHRTTKAAINDVILRGRRVGCPLTATDGVEYDVGVMVRLLGAACVSGPVLKTRRNNRVVRVERRVKIGPARRLNAALLASEDAETLNTSNIERLNLTIRQGSAHWRRRAPCHARGADLYLRKTSYARFA